MGKQTIYRKIAVAAFFAFMGVWLVFAAPAFSKVKTKAAGSVVVRAASETGSPINGVKAVVRLPGADGVIRDGMDIVVTRIDGATDDDAEAPGKKTMDGDIELPPEVMKRGIKDGQIYEIAASGSGFVENTKTYTYTSKSINEAEIVLQHAIVVTAEDASGKALPGFTVSIDKKTAGVDGGENDADKKSNGVFIYGKDIMDNRDEKTLDVVVELNGEKKAIVKHQVSTKVQRPIKAIMNGAEKK